ALPISGIRVRGAGQTDRSPRQEAQPSSRTADAGQLVRWPLAGGRQAQDVRGSPRRIEGETREHRGDRRQHEALEVPDVAAAQYRSTGSTSSDQRARRASGREYSAGTAASRQAWRAPRRAEDTSSCMRYWPARRPIGAVIGPCSSTSGALPPAKATSSSTSRAARRKAAAASTWPASARSIAMYV